MGSQKVDALVLESRRAPQVAPQHWVVNCPPADGKKVYLLCIGKTELAEPSVDGFLESRLDVREA